MARILIADDDSPIRTLLAVMLRPEGHEVHEAADGDEALRACRAGPFDLLLCDLMMPNKEGLETIREVRRAFPALRIAAMSGGGALSRGPGSVLHTARLLGANAVLAKPFSRQELLDTVRHALGGEAAIAPGGAAGRVRENEQRLLVEPNGVGRK